MGLMKKIRKARAEAKAQIKAAKVRVKAEAKENAKLKLRREKLLARQEKNLLKAEQKGLKAKRKHERAMAKRELKKIRAGQLNKHSVRRYAGAARVLTPLLIPVVYRLVTMAKEQANKAEARRFGVDSEQLAQFSGFGAPLKARLEGVRNTINNSDLPSGFCRDVEDRISELHDAVNNAEQMTPEQRTRAHRSISREIDGLTAQIQERLAI
ncbi:hypothetical protein GP475_11900 [Corynebacterium poyangense]|uniref:Uncharacterized protein n=1 Tax=Corynebacterium poyangense TaxID=2684405 RepID=A0A7H0SRT5_9CORY|nr:DUF6474 family protein [Corynebacterium poyangense]MBZ8176694.1 hypothetical protein [Corynebacterium poyangense]QNQ91260.1 hypothetical protein GP475_11900 [Corynebacterium poyangense]